MIGIKNYRWSFTRVIWGIATLLVYVHNVELLQDTDTPTRSFALLFVVFFICEVVPIVILLNYSYYMQCLMRGFFPPSLSADNNEQDYLHAAFDHNYQQSEAEGDSLLLQRPLNTVDHLLLTSPRDGTVDAGNRIRRVRFQDA